MQRAPALLGMLLAAALLAIGLAVFVRRIVAALPF